MTHAQNTVFWEMQPEKFVVYALEALKQGEHCWVVDFRVPDMTITLLVTIQRLH